LRAVAGSEIASGYGIINMREDPLQEFVRNIKRAGIVKEG
jgi:hypothetical protein